MIERANAWRRRPPRRTCQLRLAIVATLILLAPVSAPAQEPSPEVREALQKGIAAARAQQWTLALQQLDVARDKAPMLPEVLFNLALANDRMGGRDIRALGWYRAYLAVAPNAGNREAVGARITALEEAARTTAHGLIDKAVAANKLLPTEDNRNGGLAEIARAQAEIGDIDSAFATIASSAPGTMGTYVYDGGYNLLAGVFAKLGDLASADKAVRKIIAVDKRDDAIDSIVKALIEQNRIADALAYAATINGGSYRIRSYLEIAEAQAKAKDQAGARRSLDIAVSARNGMPQKERTTWHAESIIESAVKINERDVATRELDLAVKAMNALPKDPRSVGDVANLMKAAISVNDLQTVKRLYAGINWTPDAIKYGNRPLVTYLMASAYAKTGQFAEARALEPKITDPFWRGQVGNDIGSASRDADSKRSAQFKALLAQQKFSEAEAVVTRGLQTDALIQMQVELANALRKAGNVAAASRIVSMIAASVAKQPPAESIEARLSLAFAYRSAGDFTAAQHMLDAVATPAVMGLLQKDSYRSSKIRSIVDGFVRLMVTASEARNAAAARQAATAAIHAAAFIKDASTRGSDLESLAAHADTLGLDNELNAIVGGLPPGASRDRFLGRLANAYVASGNIDKAAVFATQIADANARADAIKAIVQQRSSVADWKGALGFAANSPQPAKSYAAIAVDMLRVGFVNEAMALEPKLAGSPADFDMYLAALASHFANNGEFERAVETALRESTAMGQLSSLRSVVYAADKLAGRAKAKAVFDRELALVSGLSSADHAALCKAPYHLIAEVDNKAAYQNLLSQCRAEVVSALADARATPPSAKRSEALAKALEQLNERKYVGWMLLNTASMPSSSDRSSAVTGALNLLGKTGATESRIALSRSLGTLADADYLAAMSDAAVDAGNTSVANDLLHKWYDRLAADTNEYTRDSGFATIATKLVAIGEYDIAAAVIARVTSANNRFSPLRALATALVRAGKKTQALVVIKQAAGAAEEAGYYYYLSDLARLAAECGDFAQATALQAQARDTYRFTAQVAITEALIKSGQRDKIGGALATEEAELAKQKGSWRPYGEGLFAADLAWSGADVRLEKSITGARQPELAAATLLAAAIGYAKAGRPDAARDALSRALKQLNIARPDFAAWAAYNIALAEADIDPDKAMQRMLAIDDVEWRLRGAAELSAAFLGRGQVKQAVDVLRPLPPSALADDARFAAIPSLTAHATVADARAFIGKITSATLRDGARRLLALNEARRGETEQAMADANTVESVAERAYLLVDLGAVFSEHDMKSQVQSANLAAAKVADTISDLFVKSDILTDIAQNETHTDAGEAQVARMKAIAIATTISDPADRDIAVGWATGIDLAKITADAERASKYADDFRDQWTYYLTSTLNRDLYSSVDTYVQSLSTKDPRQIVSGLAQAAGEIGDRLRELQARSADWTKKYRAAAN